MRAGPCVAAAGRFLEGARRSLRDGFRVVVLAGLAWAGAAQAGDAAQEDTAKVFPGYQIDAKGNTVTGKERVFRQLGTRERTVVAAGALIGKPETLSVRGDGRRYRLRLWEVGEGGAIDTSENAVALAVFSETTGELLDVANVKMDRWVGFRNPPILPLGPDDGFIVLSSHSNSGQSYMSTALYTIQGGRLRLVENLYTLSAWGNCDSLEQSVDWSVSPDAAGPRPLITVRVTVVDGPAKDAEGCGKRKPRTRLFEGKYRWDAGKERFVEAGGNLRQLEEITKKYY